MPPLRSFKKKPQNDISLVKIMAEKLTAQVQTVNIQQYVMWLVPSFVFYLLSGWFPVWLSSAVLVGYAGFHAPMWKPRVSRQERVVQGMMMWFGCFMLGTLSSTGVLVAAFLFSCGEAIAHMIRADTSPNLPLYFAGGLYAWMGICTVSGWLLSPLATLLIAAQLFCFCLYRVHCKDYTMALLHTYLLVQQILVTQGWTFSFYILIPFYLTKCMQVGLQPLSKPHDPPMSLYMLMAALLGLHLVIPNALFWGSLLQVVLWVRLGVSIELVKLLM